MTSKKDSLKKCPFCGGEVDLETEEYGGNWKYIHHIGCVEGCYSRSIYGDKKEAIDLANKRSRGIK